MSRKDRLVLIVDDDPTMREVVRFAVEKEGYRTQQAQDGRMALATFERSPPDLIVLDIMMPELDGTEVCREIRRTSDVPIIFLSSKDDELDRILGLELGGDDYLTKPFSPRELVARIRSVLRRFDKPGNGDSAGRGPGAAGPKDLEPARQLAYGRLILDLDTYQAVVGELRAPLTVMEFGLLHTLMTTPNKVYTRDELMNRAYDNVVVADRTIDSHIRRIRKKLTALGIDPIETVTGFGYKMGARP